MFIGTGLAMLASAAWILLNPVAPVLNSSNLLMVLLIFLTAILAGLMVSYPFIKNRAGALLYDVPRVQNRKISGLATAGMFLLLTIVTIVRTGFSHETIAEIVFYVAVIFYFASPLFGKVELRENGILDTYSLLRWKNISSYRWIGRDESNLMMNLRGSWRKNFTIILPPDQKESIDSILKKQLGLGKRQS